VEIFILEQIRCLMRACDLAAQTNALCLEQWSHLCPLQMEKGFEVDPDGRIGLRLLIRKGIFLQFRLRNVASGQILPSHVVHHFLVQGPIILLCFLCLLD
jgi:hypothetical protein